jgi:integrase
VSDYRNTRLKVVSAGTVLRELGVLSRVLSACRQEWGIEVRNSVTEIQKPKAPRGRDRRLRQGEIDLILAVLQPTMQAVVRFAIETAMRRGEIAAMKFEDVDRAHRTLLIPATKTGVPRTIPLSCGAFQIIEGMGDKDARGPVFGMTATTISQAFRRACRRAGLEDLHLHDLRHEATSRLFEKGLAVMEVALVTGHADVRMLARYTHLRAGDLVCKLG